jgi:hypothetical protein
MCCEVDTPTTPGGDAIATASEKGPNKTEFAREYLTRNPKANHSAVNEAWKKAGREGSVSETLVYRIRSEMKLTGNLRVAGSE